MSVAAPKPDRATARHPPHGPAVAPSATTRPTPSAPDRPASDPTLARYSAECRARCIALRSRTTTGAARRRRRHPRLHAMDACHSTPRHRPNTVQRAVLPCRLARRHQSWARTRPNGRGEPVDLPTPAAPGTPGSTTTGVSLRRPTEEYPRGSIRAPYPEPGCTVRRQSAPRRYRRTQAARVA
jgi:hypothetical protein